MELDIGRLPMGRNGMKDKVTKFIDLCKQYMNKELEQELDNEIRFYESTEGEDDTRTLEYLYDLSETVRTFNDYSCIVFLNLSNILTYPNETFYEKDKKKEIRITPEKAVYMANKIQCVHKVIGSNTYNQNEEGI